MAKKHEIIGFIKFKNEIGLFRADYEAWVLDLKAYCTQFRYDEKEFVARKDGRFAGRLANPVRKEDVAALVAWFDEHAIVDPSVIEKKLEKHEYPALDGDFEDHLPVILYDFDELISYENPDLNPYTPYDDFLPEAWVNIVVEGFDALVPDQLIYWSKFAARLECRPDNTL